MHPRHLLTLHSQLALPMIPLAIDTVVRTIFLWGDIEWWRIPDLWTLLVTYAFFCLAVMFSVNVPRIATDPEAHDNIELVKHRLLGSCILAVSFAGGLSCFRAIADLHPTLEMQKKFGLQFFYVLLSSLSATISTGSAPLT